MKAETIAKNISEKFRKEWAKNNHRFSDGKSIELWIKAAIEKELNKILLTKTSPFSGDKLIRLIERKFSSIKIYNQPKRMEVGEGRRDWTVRVCWEVVKDNKTFESDWEGFETTEEAVKDIIIKLEK